MVPIWLIGAIGGLLWAASEGLGFEASIWLTPNALEERQRHRMLVNVVEVKLRSRSKRVPSNLVEIAHDRPVEVLVPVTSVQAAQPKLSPSSAHVGSSHMAVSPTLVDKCALCLLIYLHRA